MGKKIEFDTTKAYGRLTLIEKITSHSVGRVLWLCKCECGRTRIVRQYCLYAGTVKSCGCLRSESAVRIGKKYSSALHKPPGHRTWSAAFSSCKQSAKKRQIEFALTFEMFKTISQNKCHYCGAPPRETNYYISSTGRLTGHVSQTSANRGWILKNGIDRYDNLKGYIEGNCVSCCVPCNEAKNDRNVAEFLEHAHNIVKYQKRVTKNASK